MNNRNSKTRSKPVPSDLPAESKPRSAHVAHIERGQAAIADIGKELRKPKYGAPTIRNKALDQEIFERLVSGEALSSVTDDPEMPSWSTIANWRRQDREFDDLAKLGMAIGQHAIVDVIQDIARGGRFSTGSVGRDKLLIDSIMIVASKRNRTDFGERMEIAATHAIATVVLPTLALPSIPTAEFDEITNENQP